MLFIINNTSQFYFGLVIMKIVLLLAAVALVKADVSHVVNQEGFKYDNPPLSSYGVPQASILGNNAQSASVYSSAQYELPSVASPSINFVNGGYSGFSTPFGSVEVSTPGPSNFNVESYQSTPAPSLGVSVSTPTVNFVPYSQTGNSYQFLSSLNQPSVSVPSTFGVSSSFVNSGPSSTSFAGQTSGGKLTDAFGVDTDAVAAQEPEISKQLYFFAAPEEEEEEEIQLKAELPQAPLKKTYKIIFIKAPAYRSKAVITVPAPVPNQEKTLVYVLVKKPEGQPKVRFQEGTPVEQPKPEVFFIKYKTQKEAEAAVAEIQNKHGATGQVIANLPAGTQLSGQSETNFESVVSSTPVPQGDINYNFGGNVVSTPEPESFKTFGVFSTPSPQVNYDYKGYGVGVSSTPTSVTFGGSSVDSLKVFGGGIAPAAPAVESNEEPAGVTESTEPSADAQNIVEGFSAYGPPKF